MLKTQFRTEAALVVDTISYIALSITSVTILVLLFRTLGRMSTFNGLSHKNILSQFILFIVSYLLNLLLLVAYFYGINFDWSPFSLALLFLSSHLATDFSPVAFMLFAHYKTFQEEKDSTIHYTSEEMSRHRTITPTSKNSSIKNYPIPITS